MERNPHLPLEGIMIAAMAIRGQRRLHLYSRRVRRSLSHHAGRDSPTRTPRASSARMRSASTAASTSTSSRGAGAYICGEESGMLESMEGQKGQPRKRPPFPCSARPLAAADHRRQHRDLLARADRSSMRGADWLKPIGMPNSSGTYALRRQRARQTTRAFTRCRSASRCATSSTNTPADSKTVAPSRRSFPAASRCRCCAATRSTSPSITNRCATVNSLLGTAGAIVMDDRTCMVRAALVVARFFEHESCGQCTQCREGTGWTYRTLKRIERGEGAAQDLETLADTFNFMDGKCICALADGASWAARAFFKQFRADFEAHITAQQVPFPGELSRYEPVRHPQRDRHYPRHARP